MYPIFTPQQSFFAPMNIPTYMPMPAYNAPMMNPAALSNYLMMNQQQQQMKAQMLSMMQMQQQQAMMMRNQLKIDDSNWHLKSTFEATGNFDDSLSIKTSNSYYENELTPEIIKPEGLIQNERVNLKSIKQNVVKQAVRTETKPVKVELEEMVRFLLDNIGSVPKVQIEEARRKYSHNPRFLPIFDAIVDKYISVKKHREDIVRYIVRRCFKYLKANTIKKRRAVGKKAYAILCKRYFQDHIDELKNSGLDITDEKELIEFILPYRKNSKNRTMNINFTAEIFSSELFMKDYKQFLEFFEGILDKDNKNKINKLSQLADECYRKGNADKIRNCTRLPWIKLWIDKTKAMSLELAKVGLNLTVEDKDCEGTDKKLKTESTFSDASVEISIKEEFSISS